MGRLSSRDRKLAHSAGENVSNIENRNFALQAVSVQQTILRGPLPVAATPAFALIADVAYWLYIGYTQKELTVSNVTVIQTVAGAGAQVAEFALASSPSAPNGAAQNLTVLGVKANTALDDFTNATVPAVRGTTGAWWQTVTPAVHLWAGIRFKMATTQPTVVGVNLDLGAGFTLATAAQTTALAAGGVYAGAPLALAIAATAQAPLIQVKLVE